MSGDAPADTSAARARLGERRARLVELCAAVVAFDEAALDTLRRSAPPGEPDAGWREVVLQAHLFCGIPRTLAALDVLARAGGLGTPGPEEVRGADEGSGPRGAALFERIYGQGTDLVRSALARHHADLERWIAEHAYARVLSRPGLDAATRELCAVAALAITGHDRQLASHARGALRCGAEAEEVHAALALVARWVPAAWRARAFEVGAQFAR